MDWFRSLPAYRQKIYALLIGAILLTLPCYCTGVLLLVLAPAQPGPELPLVDRVGLARLALLDRVDRRRPARRPRAPLRPRARRRPPPAAAPGSAR